MQIKSEEVNYIIYRYLLEAGFSHSAFVFSHESLLTHSSIKSDLVPVGALLTLLHKGLQYTEIELHTNEDGSVKACNKPVLLIEKHNCEYLASSQVDDPNDQHSSTMVMPKSSTTTVHLSSLQRPQSTVALSSKSASSNANGKAGGSASKAEEKSSATTTTSNSASQSFSPATAKEPEKKKLINSSSSAPSTSNNSVSNSVKSDHPVPIKQKLSAESSSKTVDTLKIFETDCTLLIGHSAEVFTCAWNPKDSLLATGAGDSCARIWNLRDAGGSSSGSGSKSIEESILLHQSIDSFSSATANPSSNYIITTLEWNGSGERLAAGSSEGVAYVWNNTGSIQHVMKSHDASIFSIRWNPSGEYILTGSEDSKVIVWNGSDGSVKHIYSSHDGSVLDVDWRNDECFASCSQDKTIKVFMINSPLPIAVFRGHDQEINAVKWDPTGTFLASCSDDKTAKIWDISSSVFSSDSAPTSPAFSTSFTHNLVGHTDGIYTVEWNPVGSLRMIGTASFDGSAKLWNTEVGQCMHSLSKHNKPVYSISFSPDGRYIATGSVDRNVYIWSVTDGTMVKSFTCKGGVYDLSWNIDGNKIAVCTTKSQVLVLDVREL